MSHRNLCCRVRIAIAAACALAASAAAQGSVSPLDTVTVVASRTHLGDAARVVDVITRDDIARSTARNVADILSERMGVDVYGRSAAQADLSLRGSTAEQTLVLVDGVRVSDAQSSHYALDLAVPLDAIERIEILRGAGSALYGTDAIGGVINIITRRAAAEADVRTRAGAFGTVGVAASDGTQRGGVVVNGATEYEKSDGYRAGTDYRIGQARAALSSPLGAGQFESHVGVGIRDFGANEFYGPYNSTERTGTIAADARWTVPVGDWILGTTASTRRHTDRFTLIRDNPAIYENLHTSWQSTGEVVAQTNVGGAALALGADADNAQLTSDRLGSHAEWRDAAFMEMSLGNRASPALDFGVRGDASNIYGGFLSPSLAVAIPVVDGLRLHASASRGFRAPTWTELYYVDPTSQGNTNLVPEQFWSGDAGARVGRAGAVTFDIGVFARNAQNLIDWVKPATAPASALWVATNIGDARYRGVEASLAFPSWRGVESTLTATGLTFTDAQGTGLVGKYALRPLTQQITARATYALWEPVRATFELMDARRATEDAYVTGNVRLEWQRQRLRVTLDLNNFTNAAWLDASGVDVAGRALYLGVEWR
jgi:iron complex outermembrane receptor protein